MRRVFVEEDEVQGETLTLTGDRLRYLRQVLRLRPGDRFLAARPGAIQQVATLTEIGEQQLTALLGPPEPISTEATIQITLHQAILKGDAMTLAIQKTVELGVAAIVPVICERTVVRLGPADRPAKQRRWQQIALEAARQSERTVIPQVHEPVDFAEAVAGWSEGLGLLFAEQEPSVPRVSLGEALADHGNDTSFGIFIGPEGGFTDREMELALEGGLIPVTLGPRILRAETAAMVAGALLMYELGQMQ